MIIKHLKHYWPEYLIGLGAVLSGLVCIIILVAFLTWIGY